MTDLEIRRIRFDLDGEVPFNWNAGNPAFSTYMNMVSIMAICFEKMLVAAVREAMPLITDTGVAEEADAFLRQEAQHASAHRQHLRALIRLHPGLQETLDEAVARAGAEPDSNPYAPPRAPLHPEQGLSRPTTRLSPEVSGAISNHPRSNRR